MSIDEIRSMIRAENATQSLLLKTENATLMETNLQKLEVANATQEAKLQKLEVAIASGLELSLHETKSMNTLLESNIQRLENTLDERLASQEARFMKEISELQKRAEQLELRFKDRDDENEDPAAQEAKRRRRSSSVEPGTGGMRSNARDHADLRRNDDEERHTIVFTGFAAKSRKKHVIDYVKLQLDVVERLAGHADVSVLKDKVFAPSIRTNIAMLHLPSKTAMFGFLSAWNLAEKTGQITRFGENALVIRAKRDKPPAIRKAHGKLWQLSTHLKCLGFGDVEIDWRSCSIWVYDCEVVKWDMDSDSAIWMEQEMTKHHLQIDVATANLALTRPRNS